MKQKLIGEIDKSTIILGDFNTSLSIIDMISVKIWNTRTGLSTNMT